MFIDEDGDIAHEFYEESASGTLVRKFDGLTPQVDH